MWSARASESSGVIGPTSRRTRPRLSSRRVRSFGSWGRTSVSRRTSMVAIIVNEVPPYSASSVEVVRLPEGETEPDEIAVEEPLEIRVGGRPIAVTMRTPGHDEELAVGFLRSEGMPAVSAQPTADLAGNVIDVEVEGDVDFDRLSRNFYTSSSCGVCGKGALEAVAVEAPRIESELVVPAALVAELP